MANLRFILKKVTRNYSHVRTIVQTLEAYCPALEQVLAAESYGGGPDNDDFCYVEVIGVERLDGKDVTRG